GILALYSIFLERGKGAVRRSSREDFGLDSLCPCCDCWREGHIFSRRITPNKMQKSTPDNLQTNTHSLPPWAEMMERQTPRPSPIPCLFVVKKGSKNALTFFGRNAAALVDYG